MPFDATPISSPVIDRLRRGRALVARPDGWCRGTWRDYRGKKYGGPRFCAVGALLPWDGVVYGHALRYLKIALVGREAPEMIPNRKLIADWQDVRGQKDEPGRQQHEVVALFDRAIELAVLDQLTLANQAA